MAIIRRLSCGHCSQWRLRSRRRRSHTFTARRAICGQAHDCRLTSAATIAFDAFVEPAGKRRVRLVAQAQPGKLDHGRSQSGIAGLRHALLTVDRAALPRSRREARVTRHLPAIVEVPEQAFRPEKGSELRPDALQVQQHLPRAGRRRALRGSQQQVPLHLHRLDLLENQFEPIEFAVICPRQTGPL